MSDYNFKKYPTFQPVKLTDRTWPDQVISKAPEWCSVDLRDGNQALIDPMTVSQKQKMFKLLVDVGFKQIEVGFPAASQPDFDFVRWLIEEDQVPEDVTIQVLTQARPELIARSYEALKGAKKAIIHLYNSTSTVQREKVFKMEKDGIVNLAIKGAEEVKRLAAEYPETEWTFQYSPESFTGTELDFAVEICDAVNNVWQPTPEKKTIINLPATVEMSTPNVYADQIEWFCRNLQDRDSVRVSLHTHNDRGTGTAATELGLMAGADRVEGTLFGNGERTGNLDIATVALNMNSHGIETGLDFSNIPKAREVYERCTQMKVPDRHPYAGDLVFTAFSGSHQDAIKKGMDLIEADNSHWAVPYLTIDPTDIGRTYEAIIRINSQSGKGGIAYILDREYGFDLPKAMQPQVGKKIYNMADSLGRELTNQEIFDAFKKQFVNVSNKISLAEYELFHNDVDSGQVRCEAKITINGTDYEVTGVGNGPINAFVNALETIEQKDFKLKDYRSHAVMGGSDADSAAYILLHSDDGKEAWGCGVDPSIEIAGVRALVSACNLLKD